jgi:hypothetical protein
MQRGRGLAVGLAGIAVVAVLVVREVRIERDRANLRASVTAQNGRLGEVVQGQRALAMQIGRLSQELREQCVSPPTPGYGSATASSESRAGGSEAVAKNAAPAVPSAEDIENVQKGHTLLEKAVASGRWTERDRNDFRTLLRSLPLDEGKELKRRLVIAINDRRLSLEIRGVPF